ncbi:MAG: UvrD-helicase domain-containing protein, partial [Candidatus Omnitrophota bacterium]
MAETISLNEDQKRAVTFSGRNLLVSAGAGTGKTRVLVERFLYFVTEQRVPVDRILALTYTEKAANEMRSRIQKRLRELGREEDLRGLESAYISTIHAFCARLLKEHPVEAGVDPEFRVAEEETADFLIAQSMAEVCESLCGTDREIFDLLRAFGQEKITHGILKVLTAAKREARTLEEYFAVYPAASPGKKTFEKVSSLLRELGAEDRIPDWEVFLKDEDWDWKKITDYKNWQKGFSRNKKTPWPEVKELVRELLELRLFPHVLRSRKVFERLAIAFEAHYEKKKNEQGLLDFEDLQVRALRMLERPDKASRRLYGDLRKKFNQVLVDEFQDTDPLQLRLIETISSGTNLLLVGDYKQSIYRFRGAEPSLFLAQERRYRKQDAGERMTLAKNFRSRPEVLEFVNGLFGRLWGGAGTFYEPLEAVREGWGKTAVESIVIEAEEEEDESLDAGRMREAEAIARRILALTEEGVDYGEIAVLFPAVSQLGIYEQAFRQHGIPYYAVSGRGFYHQPEIRDITSYLSFLEDPARDVAVAA